MSMEEIVSDQQYSKRVHLDRYKVQIFVHYDRILTMVHLQLEQMV